MAPVNAAKPAVFISKFQRQDDISIVDERSAFFQSISPTEGGNSEENTGRAYGTVSEQEAMTSAGDVIMYDNYLGLAIERIKDPEIKNMEELWSIG